ncbi:pancreatic triacylglycerol lipase [Coccinella septempunctata]|uniref:pancreatic triacylglycerol lipase n=1 Tax=Coccinella septempunctata TaxID=41139 RepID=UPI001D0988F6|nr:pancreatic triacylglycerol lipase [Coccinella septempunctata]
MKVLSNTLGLLINFVMAPFTSNLTQSFQNVQKNIIEPVQENIIKPIATVPLNLIRNKVTCSAYVFEVGGNDMQITAIPRGNCWNCCPVNLKQDVRFLLYAKDRPENGTIINPMARPGALRAAGVDPNLRTTIYIHGFSELSPGKSGEAIKNAYLARPEKTNFLIFDWSTLSSFPWYTQAKANVKFVAKFLSNFLETFHNSGELPLEHVHLVGFSLGAHVASFAGKYLRGGLRIKRITALDPAFPEFSIQDTSRRLTLTDADYIDVIHTDAGIFGIPVPLGHADFYPNEGKALQPGCQPSYLLNEGNFVNLVVGCSHVRAWKLYAESVRNMGAFPATRCRNWKGANRQCNFTKDTNMGLANDHSHGVFYLTTKASEPYSKTVEEQIVV